MKSTYRDRYGNKKALCGMIMVTAIAVIPGCGMNVADAAEISYTTEDVLRNGGKRDSAFTEPDDTFTDLICEHGVSGQEMMWGQGDIMMLTSAGASQSEQKPDSVMGSVPYFKDDAGQNTQTVDGYLYGYWNNRLCRYNLDTLEETVLYEAAAPQNGDFCIWGDYVYFMEVPNVNAIGKLHGYLYRVKCDGSEEAVRLTSVVMPAQSYGGSYYQSYKLDTYEDILYLIQRRDQEENLYFRLDQEGNIARVKESETLYGKLPEGEFSGWLSGWSYDSLMTLPYAMRNYGYVFMTDADRNPVRIDLESQKVEVMDALTPCVVHAVTNDAVIISKAGVWYKASLNDLDEIQEIGKILDGWERSNPQLAAWSEEGLYFTTESEDAYSGNLYFVDWEGNWTSMGRSYLGSSVVMGNYSPVSYLNGQYYYYVVNRNGVNLVRRLKLTDDQDKVAEEVAVYSKDPGCEIAYRERTDCKWTDIYTGAWVDYSMTKVFLEEDTSAFGKIMDYLEDLYAQDMALVEEYKEAVREDTEDDRMECYVDYVELSNSYSVCYLDEDYMGIEEDWDEFWQGAAHGMYGTRYYMFDRHTGSRVAITDVTGRSPEEVCEIMAPYVEAAANWGTDREGWENIMLDDDRFFLSEEGIGLHFDVYEIDSYAAGARDVIVPYSVFDASGQ